MSGVGSWALGAGPWLLAVVFWKLVFGSGCLGLRHRVMGAWVLGVGRAKNLFGKQTFCVVKQNACLHSFNFFRLHCCPLFHVGGLGSQR